MVSKGKLQIVIRYLHILKRILVIRDKISSWNKAEANQANWGSETLEISYEFA